MTALSKEEYLKRYLNPVESGDYKKRKKKNKVKVNKARGMKIIDDDVSWSKIEPEEDLLDALVMEEEKPQVEVIDTRTEEEKALDAYRKNKKWKTLDAEESEEMKNKDFDGRPPTRRGRHDSDSDMDVPRPSRRRHDSDSDSDKPRVQSERRHDSDSDREVDRSRKFGKNKNREHLRHDSDSDLDVKRPAKGHKSRQDSSSDLDIPRERSSQRNGSNEKSKNYANSNRRKHRKSHDHSSDSDLDLQRSKPSAIISRNKKRSKRKNSDLDIEVPRRARHDASSRSKVSLHDSSEGRKPLKKADSDSDLDVRRPKVSRHDTDSDLETPRRKQNDKIDDKEPERKKQMSSGGKGGLTSRHQLKAELEERMKKESDIDRLAKESSKSATVFREKGGKKRDLEKERMEKREEEKEKQKRVDKYEKWGKGVTQSNMKDYALEDLIHESNKPLARYRDDADLDAFQRSQMRDGDPMAEYLAKKKSKEAGSNVPSLPKYRGPPAPPNRYHIQPGYRWDGVDRSNGFEKKFFMKQSEGTAQKQEAYKWSVEDM